MTCFLPVGPSTRPMTCFLYKGHSIICGAASFWSALGQFSLNRYRQIRYALGSPGEFAEKDEGCEPRSGENAGIAGPIVEGLRDHAFRRHGDERPGSVCLEDCHRVRAKVTQEVEGKSRDRRSNKRSTAP